MADDLADALKEIRALKRDVERLKSARSLENSSITSGRMRFVGGLLRVDSGGRVEIVGSLQVDGATIATGTFRIEGPWTFTGNGTISGNVNITGTLTQNGTWVFNGNGTITGDVSVTGGGRIRAGQIVLNPAANGGRIEIGAHTIYVSGDVLSINHSSGAQLVMNNGGANLIGGGKILGLSATGISFVGVPTVPSSQAGGASPGSAWFNTSSQLHRVVAG